jgi:molybdate transport system substrate-binding protein
VLLSSQIIALIFATLAAGPALHAQPILVAAASDLTPLEKPLADGARSQGAVQIRFSFGSSGMLARQIRSGAPFDVFLSANEGFIRELQAAGALVNDTIQVYATGRIALWSHDGRVQSPSGLTQGSVRYLALPSPEHAPYGLAAQQALERLGLWPSLKRKIVFAENVRQAYEYARTGNADAVITSWTLLHDKEGILLAEALHAPIRQSGAVVRGTRRENDARRFLDFLTSPAGRKILTAGGLFPPP